MRWPRTTVRHYLVGIAILAPNLALLAAAWKEMQRDPPGERLLGSVAALACFSYFWLPILGALQPLPSARRMLWIAGVLGLSGVCLGGVLALQARRSSPWPGVMFGLASLVPVCSAALGYVLARRRARSRFESTQCSHP